jgi:hypothetical protein
MIRTRVFRTLALLAAVPTCAIITSATPASATDAFTIIGTGTITPGLPCTNCQVDFGFSAIGVGENSGIYTGCTLTGTTSGLANELGEAGSGTVGGCGMSGNITWVRVGTVQTISGTVCINGKCYTICVSAFAWAMLSVAPTTSFTEGGGVGFC